MDLGHPTTVLHEDGKTIITVYPKGHGKGGIVYKRSDDGGLTWSERLPTPATTIIVSLALAATLAVPSPSRGRRWPLWRLVPFVEADDVMVSQGQPATVISFPALRAGQDRQTAATGP